MRRRCETKTRDNVFVTLVISVQYQVQKENLFDAFYRLTNSNQQISSYIFDVVRATVPKVRATTAEPFSTSGM